VPRLSYSSSFKITVPNLYLISVDANNLHLVKELTDEQLYTLSLCENLLQYNCGDLRFMGAIIFILNIDDNFQAETLLDGEQGNNKY
jgi:hypothetical protein